MSIGLLEPCFRPNLRSSEAQGGELEAGTLFYWQPDIFLARDSNINYTNYQLRSPKLEGLIFGFGRDLGSTHSIWGGGGGAGLEQCGGATQKWVLSFPMATEGQGKVCWQCLLGESRGPLERLSVWKWVSTGQAENQDSHVNLKCFLQPQSRRKVIERPPREPMQPMQAGAPAFNGLAVFATCRNQTRPS